MMIVLSVGMPRAGSGWHYNLVNDLMKTTGCADARDIRERYHLQSILTEVNCNIGVLSARRLAMVALPALMGNTFVIKAHAGPTSASRLLQRLGLLRITYIYRDPRDAMLSAYDYGQRALKKGHPNAFSHLTDFQKSVDFIMEYVRIWEKWVNEKGVLIARYEDLLTDYEDEATRLVGFLKLNGTNPEVQKVIDSYRPGTAEGQQGLHFYKGKIGRFRESYGAEEQAILKEKLGSYLQRMGYEI
ncbi:MAG TPA: sulfotransferase domain-containing protein [Anaerolineales bacterium]|nr:sulfotransferase domain-containing protein [Anaerolineales bacterium]